MRFTLRLTLPDDEVADEGAESVIRGYLHQVARKCAQGNSETGTIRDADGNKIGTYYTTNDDGNGRPVNDRLRIGES